MKINYEDNEFYLLIEICILLLKAGRKTISGKELDSICEKEWGYNRVAGRLSLKYGLATATVSIRNKFEIDFIELKYSLEFYKAIKNEINCEKEHEKKWKDMKYDFVYEDSELWKGNIPPEALSYKDFEVRKEIMNNRNKYMGQKIRDKIVSGIGPQAIVLTKDNKKTFHNYIAQKYFILKEGSSIDGCELGRELIRKYNNLEEDLHLKYICDVED